MGWTFHSLHLHSPPHGAPRVPQTRRRRTLDDSTLDRVRGTYRKERAWPHLSGDEITQRIAESEARRRQQDLRMPPAQYDAEKK